MGMIRDQTADFSTLDRATLGEDRTIQPDSGFLLGVSDTIAPTLWQEAPLLLTLPDPGAQVPRLFS